MFKVLPIYIQVSVHPMELIQTKSVFSDKLFKTFTGPQ